MSFSSAIPLNLNGTVVTNSPSIALNHSEHPEVRIRLLPGELNKETKVIEGSDTISAIRNIKFRLMCFRCFVYRYQ